MGDNIFKCGIHNFSTDNLKKWDKHYAEFEHEYDLHIDCAAKCGEKLHIKPKQKLGFAAKRIPRGYMCDECKKKVNDVSHIMFVPFF